jgi:hypothetical protein
LRAYGVLTQIEGMKKILMFVLGMVLLVACGEFDPMSAGPAGLNTTVHSESNGTWPDGPTASDISWRFLELNRISYQMTWTNNDPLRAVTVWYSLHFVDDAGFEIWKSNDASTIISAASSRDTQDIISQYIIDSVDLANQISAMEVWASFTFD